MQKAIKLDVPKPVLSMLNLVSAVFNGKLVSVTIWTNIGVNAGFLK